MLKLVLPFIKKSLAAWLDGVISRSTVVPEEVKPLLVAEINKELGVS